MQMGLSRGVSPASDVAMQAPDEAVVTNVSAEASVDGKTTKVASATTGNWDDDGWSTDGRTE